MNIEYLRKNPVLVHYKRKETNFSYNLESIRLSFPLKNFFEI